MHSIYRHLLFCLIVVCNWLSTELYCLLILSLSSFNPRAEKSMWNSINFHSIQFVRSMNLDRPV